MTGAAGVVLAGGRSTRMGAAKAGLEWHGSTLLRRTVGLLLRGSLGPIVVVRALGQPLPALPADVAVVDDPVEGLGPLQGLAAGLGAVAGTQLAFVCATDLPFLHPAVISHLVGRARDSRTDAVVPLIGGRRQPLAAVYSTALAVTAQELLDEDGSALVALLDRAVVHLVAATDLLADAAVAAADPALESFLNLNAPWDYSAARARPAPTVSVLRAPGAEAVVTRAATLAAAAQALGIATRPALDATICGRRTKWDPETPLLDGDAVVLHA